MISPQEIASSFFCLFFFPLFDKPTSFVSGVSGKWTVDTVDFLHVGPPSELKEFKGETTYKNFCFPDMCKRARSKESSFTGLFYLITEELWMLVQQLYLYYNWKNLGAFHQDHVQISRRRIIKFDAGCSQKSTWNLRRWVLKIQISRMCKE